METTKNTRHPETFYQLDSPADNSIIKILFAILMILIVTISIWYFGFFRPISVAETPIKIEHAGSNQNYDEMFGLSSDSKINETKPITGSLEIKTIRHNGRTYDVFTNGTDIEVVWIK